MAILKVLAVAVAGGILFAGFGMSIVDWIEKSVGRGSTVVIMAMGCVGAILGSVAAAAQVVVDVIRESKQ